MKKLIYSLIILAVIFVYLLPRVGWVETIEFGYDQPKLASQVVLFLEKPTFLSAYGFVESNPWGSPSWGPMQLFFYAPFLVLSKHPLIVSQLVAFFNLLSILIVILIGFTFFGPKVGVVSGLLLATHPWWIIFSRMIYQPTPVPTFVTLAIFFIFYLLRKPRSRIAIVIFPLLAVLFQLYIHTVSFILPIVFLLVFKIRKFSKKYILFGFLITLVLFLPYVKYYLNNLEALASFIKTAKYLQDLTKGSNFFLAKVIEEFTQIISGGGLNWQLGYGFDEFIKTNPLTPYLIFISLVFIFLAVGYHLGSLFQKGTKNKDLVILLLVWTFGPIWFLSVVNAPEALPRYFILSLPAVCLLVAIFIERMASKFFKPLYFTALILAGVWIYEILSYFNFVSSYSYDFGFLSHFSDPPYIFLDSAFRWIYKDASRKKSEAIFIVEHGFDDNVSIPTQSIKYVKENIDYSRYKIVQKEDAQTNYVIQFAPAPSNLTENQYVKFGPYVVYQRF